MRRLVAVLAVALALSAATTPAVGAPTHSPMKVLGVKTEADLAALERTGAQIDHLEHGVVYVQARPEQAAAIRKLGFKVADVTTMASPVDPGYHDFPETVAEIDRIVAAFPALASKTVIGQSHEGKDIIARPATM